MISIAGRLLLCAALLPGCGSKDSPKESGADGSDLGSAAKDSVRGDSGLTGDLGTDSVSSIEVADEQTVGDVAHDASDWPADFGVLPDGSVADGAAEIPLGDTAWEHLDAGSDVDVDADTEWEPFPFEPCGAPGGNGKDDVPMCPVPGGEFWMGAPDWECEQLEELLPLEACQDELGDEQPAHLVSLAPYLIDQTEIRASRYRDCVLAGACSLPKELLGCQGPEPQGDAGPQGDGGNPGSRGPGGTVSGVFSCDSCIGLAIGAVAKFVVAAGFPPLNAVKVMQVELSALPFQYEIAGVPEGSYVVTVLVDMPPTCPGLPGLEDFVGVSGGFGSPKKITVVAEQDTPGVDIEGVPGLTVLPIKDTCTLANPDTDNMPMSSADWYQYKEYCEWAGKRLCTEAEWEMAAAGSEPRIWPWGNTWQTGMGNAYDPEADDFDWVSPVGSFPDAASPYGCLDMDANLMEFVQDWYDSGYYAKSPVENPLGACDAAAECPEYDSKVLRGVAWRKESGSSWGVAFDSRLCRRLNYHATGWFYDDVGARCCQSQ